MASNVVLMLVALVMAVNLSAATDYCSKDLTCGNQRNIMCNAQAKFGPACRSASYVPISDDIRNRFLKGHNEKRSLTAQGKLGGAFKTASRMATMVWDGELERMALQNVYQCKMQHDQCRRTQHYVYAGQNLAMSCSSPNYQNVENVIDTAIKNWFDEYKNLPPQWINAYGKGAQPRGQVGHFTQVARDKAFTVGCSIVKSISSMSGRDWNCYYIACNYATTNMVGLPVYETGPMGRKCKTGMNHNYAGLCSERESYYDDKQLFH